MPSTRQKVAGSGSTPRKRCLHVPSSSVAMAKSDAPRAEKLRARHRKGLEACCNRSMLPTINLRFPSWLDEFLGTEGRTHASVAGRVRLVTEMSRLNVEHGTGGPFAAAIFNRSTGVLIAPGVNVVEGTRCSVAHAEIMAIMAAQQLVGHYDLGAGTGCPVEIVSSTEPCAMCQGAIVWAGISSLVYAARGSDACRIGFDEGIKSPDWIRQFRRRGISVAGGVCRREAAAVLRDYRKQGGLIYNGVRSQRRGGLTAPRNPIQLHGGIGAPAN